MLGTPKLEFASARKLIDSRYRHAHHNFAISSDERPVHKVTGIQFPDPFPSVLPAEFTVYTILFVHKVYHPPVGPANHKDNYSVTSVFKRRLNKQLRRLFLELRLSPFVPPVEFVQNFVNAYIFL
jgi:hypothetical protein